MNARLTAATPREILEWAVERFRPRLTMATAFGAEGCVLLHLLAEIEPDGTGVQSGHWLPVCGDAGAAQSGSRQRYGIEVELIRPETTVAEYEAAHGGPLYVSHPDQCCYDRKIVPLRRALVGYDAWITAIRGDQSSHRAAASGRGAGPEIRPGEDQPALDLDPAGCLGVYRDAQGAVQSACTIGVMPRSAAGRARVRWRPTRRTGGPLGGPREDRMRAALAGQQSALMRLLECVGWV